MAVIEERVRRLNQRPVGEGRTCVLYVMDRDQRLGDNHALAAAQALALERRLPLAVLFCLQLEAGRRAREHYQFMLDGLRQLEQALATYGIPFMLLIGPAAERMHGVQYHLQPAAVYFDFSPLPGPRRLHQAVARAAGCAVFEADTYNLAPVWADCDKPEAGDRTRRPKLHRQLARYLADVAPDPRQHPHAWPGTIRTMAELQPMIDDVLAGLPDSGTDISDIRAGEAAAGEALEAFVAGRLAGYAGRRSDHSPDGQGGLSPYLHYGQLSAAQAARRVLRQTAADASLQADADAFIEELMAPEELPDNPCF